MSQDRKGSPSVPHPFAVSIQQRLQQGLALHQQGRLIEAERCYRDVLKYAPADFDVLHLLGVVLLQTQRTESGVDLIGKAVAVNPNSWGAHNNLGNGLRDLGRLEAALASFDMAIALKPDFAEAHNNRGIVLRDLERLDDALASFDRAIALKPDHAEAHNNRGTVLQDLQRGADALAGFDNAIALRPDYPEAFNNRGNAAKELGRQDKALADFNWAIALRPSYATAHYNRATVLRDVGRLDEALAGFDRAIAHRPDYAEAHNNRGLVLQERKRFDEAIAGFEKAIALNGDYAEAHTNLGLCLLQLGRFAPGWQAYEWRKKLAQPFGNRAFAPPLWLGREDISGRTVFIHWEQGLGDTIQFCRFAPLLQARGARVVMAVQEPLYRLLRPMSPGLEIINAGEVPHQFDYHCPLLSLPLALATTAETIPAKVPYLAADPALQRAWDARLPPKTRPRVGIVWSGSGKYPHRWIDWPAFAALLSPDVHWMVLQKELGDSEAAAIRALPHVASYSEELTDFAETAALVEALDLVISVDTSVAHLAGAMGKPVWVLLPEHGDWRWLEERSDSPWYPTARLFRQDGTRSWAGVMTRVRAALDEFLRSRS